MKEQTFQSFEDFSSALRKETISYPDLNSLRNKIYSANLKQKPSSISNFKTIPISLLIIGLCIIFFTGTTVSALYMKFVIQNKEGNISFILTQTSEEQMEKDRKAREISSQWEYLKDEVRESLDEGEVAIIVIPELYEVDKHYYFIQHNIKYSSIEEMKSATSSDFFALPSLANTYHFLMGEVFFITPWEFEEIEKLYLEAKQLGKPYMIQKGFASKEARSITIKYEGEEINHFTPYLYVFIREVSKELGFAGMSTSDSIQKVEIINIDGAEILYDPLEGKPSIIFLMEYNGATFVYEIHGNMYTTKEDLISMYKEISSHLNQN